MSILDDIIAYKREEVRRQERETPLENLPPRTDPVRDFAAALGRPGLQVIAEVKRKSPSTGDIRVDLDPVDLARAYQRAGAAAISVLTDEHFFSGRLFHLRAVREAVDLPVLRKDFIITEYQVHESFSAGADAILLIADALPEARLKKLYELACSLDLHVLVEGYRDESLAVVNDLSPEIAGINSRNLTTMEIDLDAMLARRPLLPDSALHVAESGIAGPAELARVARSGYAAALIGTALLREGDPESTLRHFLEGLTAAEAEKT